MHASDNLPFKSFTPYLVANLEDPDGMVRETAKSAVVELFRCACALPGFAWETMLTKPQERTR